MTPPTPQPATLNSQPSTPNPRCSWRDCMFHAVHEWGSGPHQWAHLCDAHNSELIEACRRGHGRKIQAAARLAKSGYGVTQPRAEAPSGGAFVATPPTNEENNKH